MSINRFTNTWKKKAFGNIAKKLIIEVLPIILALNGAMNRVILFFGIE